jgi:hypothetical protein
MSAFAQSACPRAAVVSRPHDRVTEPDQYLMLTPQGVARWTDDPTAATPFPTMREAMRAAVRLPGSLRAFGLPLATELMGSGRLH